MSYLHPQTAPSTNSGSDTESSTTPTNNKTMQQTHPTTTTISPILYAIAAPNEFDIDTEVWKEA